MRGPDAERTLPHNLEAERSVLGAILLHNEAYEKVAGILSDSDFYRDAHRRIWASIDGLLEWKGGSADLVTIKDDLGKRGELEEVGGPAYIAALVDGVPRSTNIEHYATIIREKARLRALIFAANKIVAAAYEAEESAERILSDADRAIIELQNGARGGRLVSLAASAPALLENLEWRVQHRGELTGIETGFPQINELTLGWQPGELIIIAARPSIGKTTFAMNTAVAAARAGKRVAVFSLEMRLQQLQYRMLASLSNVPLGRVLSGAMMEPDWPPLSATIGQMHSLPIAIDDRSGQTVWDIRTACRRLKGDEGLDLVVIDYVQLIPGTLDRRGATRNDEVTDISRRLKTLTDECSVPVLLLSQLSRANEKRPDPRPKLSDLRESGALEQDADKVCFLHRRNHREGGTTNWILEKDRSGPTGTINLTLDRDIVTFTDGGDDPPPEMKKDAGAKARGRKNWPPKGGGARLPDTE